LSAEAQTRTSGSNVNSCQALTKFSTAPNAPTCLSATTFIVSFQPAEICPPPPDPLPRECPPGMLGAWAQSATVGPAPACQITWAPNEPNPGDCFTLDRTATVSWISPTKNTDGSTLTNLSGFRVSYGNTIPDERPLTVQIADPGVSRYLFTTLPSGRWYFSVKCYTSTGAQSDNSSVGTKLIP
jgi:hypothetical protein